VGKYHITNVTWSQSHGHNITSYDGSHNGYGKTVHRPCSSCISSIENLMGTPLSSPCQLRLGG